MKQMKKRIILTAAAALWMGVIFFFSAQPATESAQLSGGIVAKLQELLSDIPLIGGFFHMPWIEFFIRKAAHASEYTILGVLLFLAVREYENVRSGGIRLAVSWILGTLYAVTDEIHQLFVPGRSCELRDMGIDSLGVFAGAVAVFVIFTCICKKKEVY